MTISRRGLILGGLATIVVAASSAPSEALFGLFKKKEQVVPGGQTGPATVNSPEAAAKISDYRRSRGQSAVTVDATLTAIALRQAQAMARAGKMSHTLGGSFSSRLGQGGYDALIAAENLAAGPRNLDEALSSWRASKGHNENLLKPGVTQIGIAVAYASNNRYGNFWALVLGTPDTGQQQGPDAGPPVGQ
ncbi:MAG: CAP domain-containing protein [Rhizobiales bacterium]|nr:CAP domain-containing protein [Hyphomicrobiales bacterium]